MGVRIGIDAGSKTIKLVILDDDGKVLHSLYKRHRAAIKTTLTEVLHEACWRFGEIVGPVAVTGSAGIAVADLLGLPFVQEVVATTKAVEYYFPDADVIIELGGEDAKVVYLGDRIEQRMNATCAGGTGGFIDTIAFMLGVQTGEMSSLAMSANKIYPIASRCAVFAQTDVRPLLNAGVKKNDLAASVLEAVVQQTIGGLACGRAISGKVVFLGGPLEYIPELFYRFRRALKLEDGCAIKPLDAHLFTCRGAALSAGEAQGNVMSLKVLERRVAASPDPEDDLEHLPALFSCKEERKEFERRHASCKMPRNELTRFQGNAYLGLDAGSTTVKLALIDAEGRLLYSDYKPTEGDAFATASLMLGNMYRALPKDYRTKKSYVNIVSSCVTGYGEDLLKAGFKMDGGVVETLAHVRAARFFRPDVSFVLDIGGQDMKALWIKDGVIEDAVLNEACSSGCGSFIEGTAYSLQSTPVSFSQAALTSTKPIDLGTKCTVFMTSRVRHAQKIGAPKEDIAAGIAYSVVQNALYKIIGRDKVSTMGSVALVQGGAFKSDAVLRAFELISDVEVIRPDTAHLMGAIGSALIAKDRVEARMQLEGLNELPASNLLSEEQRKTLRSLKSREKCQGCGNACTLSVMDFGDGRKYVSGNKCDRAYQFVEGAVVKSSEGVQKPPNAIKKRQSLLRTYGDVAGSGARSGVTLGLMNTLLMHRSTPFWHKLLSSLGFGVAVPNAVRSKMAKAHSTESIPSESVCYAAKLSHERFYGLVESGVSAVFMPSFVRSNKCAVSCQYPQALADAVPGVFQGTICLVSPQLANDRPLDIANCVQDLDALRLALNDLLEAQGVDALIDTAEFAACIHSALDEQIHFDEKALSFESEALAWVNEAKGRKGVVVSSKQYLYDAQLIHGIDEVLSTLGVAVLTGEGLGAEEWRIPDEWPHAGDFFGVAAAVVNNPSLSLVCLESFGCGYDAISLSMLKEAMHRAGASFTALKIDDIADVAHIRIRLRTLVESAETQVVVDESMLVKELCYPSVSSDAEEEEAIGATAGGVYIDTSSSFSPLSEISGFSSIHELGIAHGAKGRALELLRERHPEGIRVLSPAMPTPAGKSSAIVTEIDVLERPLERADWEYARQSVCSDMCSTAASLLARCLKLAAENPMLRTIRVPKVCTGCQLDSLPAFIAEATSGRVVVEWVEPAACFQDESAAAIPDDNRLRIGVTGNCLLTFSQYLNDGIETLLGELGCHAFFPQPQLVSGDEVTYEGQMAAFDEAGVDHVIYLQSFGCLKGHVQSRGKLHHLAAQFPDLPVTIIDVDPESSALNRENRVRLAVAAALRMRPDAPDTPLKTKKTYAWLGEVGEEVYRGAQKLASGADPLASDDAAVSLSYLLEEGAYKGRLFDGPAELDAQLKRDLDEAQQRLNELNRKLSILKKAHDALE